MKPLFFAITAYIERFFFGSRCSGCGAPGPALCQKCLLSIRLSDITEHDGIFGLYDYGNPLVSHAVWNLKYRHRGAEMKLLTMKASDLISEIIAEELQSIQSQELILVPIPQYKTKTRTRGFNQSEIIASWMTHILPDSHIERVLEKITETLPQSHLSDKKARMKNITGAMRATKELNKNKIYIVIDDVTTTGATFLEAVRALKSGGAKHILCIALAHGYKRR
jgi:ComF family protein